MSRRLRKRLRRNWLWLALLLLVWLFCSGEAQAGALADRLQQFPDWSDKPPTQAVQGELVYPGWMQGTWKMTTTLVDMAAPLAPELQTPGFDGNRQWLNQPVTCRVRFVPAQGSTFPVQSRSPTETQIVADRAFNGLNLARAYLGKDAVRAVRVDPQHPNRQVMVLRGDRRLASKITERATETVNEGVFVATEISQQIFRGAAQPYLNQVETTTAYYRQSQNSPNITADQVTAIYLSPQDPAYFQAPGQPVALYRYRLTFDPVDATGQ